MSRWTDWRRFELLMALTVPAGIAYSIWHLLTQGYLPQPFFYQPYDVWMDWFNTAFWSHNPGAYDSWGTLYPPVSFLLLRFLTLGHCYVANEGLYSRDCDWLGLATMHGWYVLNIYLVGRTFLKIDRSTALPRSLAVAAGFPMLDGLERGNLIMVAFTCFLLAHGPLLRSARLRWLMAGLAINFKVYLIGSIFAYPLRRRWRWFEGALFATVAVYLVTWGLLGAGTPVELVGNLLSWGTQVGSVSSLLDIWYATSYQAVIAVLTSPDFFASNLLGSHYTELFSTVLPQVIRAVQLIILAGAAATWLRPEVVPPYRVVNLTICLALVTTEGGGYAQALVILLTLFEPWRSGWMVRTAFVCCYILAVPGDIYIEPVLPQQNNGFLNTGPLFFAYWVTVGPFVRPAIVMVIPVMLSLTTIAAVWRDIRGRGPSRRLRFRRDLPIMVEGGRLRAS